MEKFYFSLAAGSQYKTAKILKYPYILLNSQSQSNHRPTYKIESLFVDCGGFSSSFRHGGYKTTDMEYLDYIRKVEPDFYALRDYPCEPELLKQLGRSVKEHQDLTLEHHTKLLDLIESEGNVPGKYIPVIQGWTVPEYLDLIDIYESNGLITDYMAIGSVCRRTGVNKIKKVLLKIHERLPTVKLHGFGVKFSTLKDKAVWDALYSVDSGAWDYAARWRKLKENFEGAKSELSLEEGKKYMDKIDYLRCYHASQTSLIKKLH